MAQPSCGGAKRFDPTTGVKVTYGLRACNQKKTKNFLHRDELETHNWRWFSGNRASQSTTDAGVESVLFFRSETGEFRQDTDKGLRQNEVRKKTRPASVARF